MQLFYAPDVDFSTGRYLLSGEESRHCARVLRLRSGDFVHITDGRGTLCRAEIVSVSPHGCELSLGERTENFEKRSYFLQVAVAPTKNMDRLEWFAEKATEIGIDRITPFRALIGQPFDGKKLIAHCEADAGKILLRDCVRRGENVLVLIGPEGDFSKEEIALAYRNGFVPVSLGNSRLRTETAAVVATHSVAFLNEK